MPRAGKALLISQAWVVGVKDLLHLPLTHFLAWVRTRRRDKESWTTGQTCEEDDTEELTSPWAAVPGVPNDHEVQESLQK
jgi:hypothetical protein